MLAILLPLAFAGDVCLPGGDVEVAVELSLVTSIDPLVVERLPPASPPSAGWFGGGYEGINTADPDTGGEQWSGNPSAGPLIEDAGLDDAASMAPDPAAAGDAVPVVVIDNRQSGWDAIGGHYDLQGAAVAGVAPGAEVSGATITGGFWDNFWSEVGLDPIDLHANTVEAACYATDQAGSEGVVSWVADLQRFSDAQVIEVLDQLGEASDAGAVVVIAGGSFTPDQLSSPEVLAALEENGIVLMDAPIRGDDPPNTITPSGQSVPETAGDAVTISVPTELGHGSVATPATAGAIAILRQLHPELSGAAIRDLLGETSNYSESTTIGGAEVPVFDAAEIIEAAGG